jgi:hypothetical protein
MDQRTRAYDAIWRALLAGHRGMDTRVRTMAKRNAGILLLMSATWPWCGWWPLVGYVSASVAMSGHRAVRYLATWSFRRHVHEPVATVLDNVIRPRTPSGQGLVHVDIPKNFRDRESADIRVHVPMDWPATKEDMTAVHRSLEQRLSVSGTVATWTLTGRRPYGHFTMPAKPPKSVDMTDMLGAVDMAADTDLVMGAGPAGKVVSFDLTADSPHLLINAQSMAGKSELLAWLIAQFMRRGYGVLCLDAKFVSHMWLRRIPGVLYAAESEELHEALLWLDGELLRRARFVSSGGDPAALVPLVAVLEEMTSATNRLRGYWKSIEGKGMSPALTALANLANMGREMRVHILLAGQSVTAKVTGGPEGRESFGGRVMGKATANAWRMLTNIRPIPKHAGMPGRWHLVVGDKLLEFQAPFCDIKEQTARLIEWATGGAPTPDVPAMMLGGGGGGENLQTRRSAPPTPRGMSLRDYVADRADIELVTLLRWRERRDDFPEPIGEGERGTKLYEPEDLDTFVQARVG